MALKELVVIENPVLIALASNAAAVKEFPFLAALTKQAGRGCGGCGRKVEPAGDVYTAAKLAIYNLASDRKRRLMQLLGARQIRLFFTPPGGKKQLKLTFH